MERKKGGLHIRLNRKKKKHSGFTLVEMLVTLTMLSILLTLTVTGLNAWQDWANFKRQNEYAQTLFLAAQNQLAEFAANGRLQELQKEFEGENPDQNVNQYDQIGFNLTKQIGKMVNPNGETYSLSMIFPESATKQESLKALYQDEIVSLRAETGDYAKYLENPDQLKATDPEAYWLFELLGSYVYDTSILNGSQATDEKNGVAICVEITPSNGQVFSVLYSDRNDKFIYLGLTGDTHGTAKSVGVADVANRREDYREDQMVGYYGVDSLSAATENTMIQPEIASVKLHNKETFYLTCKLASKYNKILTSALTYEIDLDQSKDYNDKKLTISLDGSKLKNEEHAERIDCPVTIYDETDNPIELGVFPFLAWVDNKYTIHVVYDAADIQATTDLYEKELDEIRDPTKVASTDFAKTYSFFRFGVGIDNVYASVVAKGDKYMDSKVASNFGNLNPIKNQLAKHVVFAGEQEEEENGKTRFRYSLMNARHLYNIRYIEDLSYEKEAGSIEAAELVAGVSFELKKDIDWQAFQQEEQLFDSEGMVALSSLNNRLVDGDGENRGTVSILNCDFPSISQIRRNDSLIGNGKTMKGFYISELSNALYGIYLKEDTMEETLQLYESRPVGLVNVNYGQIKDLKIDESVVAGSCFVGGFCGVNAGSAEELEMLNTAQKSVVTGKKNVGGIFGFQMPSQEKVEIKKLVNYSTVSGVEGVGGIVGMVRNDFENVKLAEFTGFSNEVRERLNHPEQMQLSILECENYGKIAGVSESDLKGIYTSESETGPVDGDETESRYIGGIAGYCYNRDEEHTDRIQIEEAISIPYYEEEKLSDIMSNPDKLMEKLRGVYVGGIVGYNYYGEINNCSTKTKRGEEGYLFGYQYVGGIVGYNIGPASGIVGTSLFSKQAKNTNHVLAYSYAGGITGCNSGVLDVDSEGNDIKGEGKKDPDKLIGLLIPDRSRNLNVKIDNWQNEGIVIAVHGYSGGITGYNTGYIYRCNSKVEAKLAEQYFVQVTPGDYAGGITGYNNGVIGNRLRKISEDGKTSTVEEQGETFSTVCYVKGHNYVGGIVGYNDVDAIIEDYEIASGCIYGDASSCYVGGYAGLNASILLLQDEAGNSQFIKCSPNEVQGDYFVGGCIGANMINGSEYVKQNSVQSPTVGVNNVLYHGENSVEPDEDLPIDICTEFKTDNFLGTLSGKEFVGGFIGYNIVFDKEEYAWDDADAKQKRGAVYHLQNAIVQEFKSSDDTYRDEPALALKDKMDILNAIPERLGLQPEESEARVVVAGDDLKYTKNAFGMIDADLFVGGVIGINDENTNLLIKNVENATLVEAKSTIENPEQQVLSEQDGVKEYRTTDYSGEDKTYLYSYVGGIIGKVGKNVTLSNCRNASTGDVVTKGTYRGGLCEVNEGQVLQCQVSSFGSSVDDYVGGICGLNQALIADCVFEEKTVSGRNVVGGIVAENYGEIRNITLKDANLLVSGMMSGNRDGVAGIYAGFNGDSGSISVKQDVSGIRIVSGGRYVGGIVGVNEGDIKNQKEQIVEQDPNTYLSVSGKIQGYKVVGGIVGWNRSKTQEAEGSIVENPIAYYNNKSSVIATYGEVGGIVGKMMPGSCVRFCANEGAVTAIYEGNAGGITCTNDGKIEDCYDFKTVSAPKGMCGGIVAINEKDGMIERCSIMPVDKKNVITFVSTEAVGGVSAQNYNQIRDVYMENVTVMNDTSVLSSDIGVVTGQNKKGGIISLSGGRSFETGEENRIKNCSVVIQSNYSRAGGITGTNEGRIEGELQDDKILTVVNCKIKMERASIACVGGIAGVNSGNIYNVAVDASIQGEMGTDTSGYGGIAGFSGYRTNQDYEAAIEQEGSDESLVQITNCSFDGFINAKGSSGSPARIGGIVGINGYGSKIDFCAVGVREQAVDGSKTEESGITTISAGDLTKGNTKDNTDSKSYSFTGGIAGANYGTILSIDGKNTSKDEIQIITFAGATGGMVGYNYENAVITGHKDEAGKIHWLTTGENWSITMRCSENDRGPGGIIGYNRSGNSFSYVENHADIFATYRSNVKSGGLIGVCEQRDLPKLQFYQCKNYGNVTGDHDAGGFIGMLMANGISCTDCENYGEIYAYEQQAGGFVGLYYHVLTPSFYTNSINHGFIHTRGSSNRYVGGFIGKMQDSSGDSSMFNCVNTGIVRFDNDTLTQPRCGSFFGAHSGRWTMDVCRNYNTDSTNAVNFTGIGNVTLKNCLDNSNMAVRHPDENPKGGATVFYLDEMSDDSVLSHNDYGAFFSFHQVGNFNLQFNEQNYGDLRNPALFLSEPSVMNRIVAQSKTPEFVFHVDYDEDSEGMHAFQVYFWNGNKDKLSTNMNVYSYEAIFTDEQGHNATVTGTGSGWYLPSRSKTKIQVPEFADDEVTRMGSHIQTIRLKVNGTEINQNVFLRGFSWIPKENTNTEAACTFLANRNGTTFTLAELNQSLNTDFQYDYQKTYVKHIKDDIFAIDWQDHTRFKYRTGYNNYLKFNIDVQNRENATGMESFLFYLKNRNISSTASEKDRVPVRYTYTVTFVDENEKCATVGPEIGTGYDCNDPNWREQSRCEVKVPNQADDGSAFSNKIKQIKVAIGNAKYTEPGATQEKSYEYVNFGGFSWIPVGGTEQKLAANSKYAKKDVYYGNSYTRLFVDTSNNAKAPFVYSPYDYEGGFFMDANNPIHSTYYADHEDYQTSSQYADGTHKRIKVYEDLDPKFVTFIQIREGKESKLKNPELVLTAQNGYYHLTWKEVPYAYVYKIKYTVKDPNGNEVESDEYEQGSQNRAFDLPILSEWEKDGYVITFFVKAINSCHFTQNTEKYDSEWSQISTGTRRVVLPQPSVHLEVTSGNKTIAILDNYEEYVEKDCLDCTVFVEHGSIKYEIDVSKGKYSELEEEQASNNVKFKAYAKANDATNTLYVSSKIFETSGEGLSNKDLVNADRYVTTNFVGFFGDQADAMTYQIEFSMNSKDSYVMTDIGAYDEQIGTDVVYATDITHAAASNGGSGASVTMTSKLSNLPAKWFAKDCKEEIVARAYMYHSQFDVMHYGHDVAKSIVLDGKTADENRLILSTILDPYYIDDSGQVLENESIWDESAKDGNGDLKDGYVLLKNEDGTYNIFYNATIALSKQAAKVWNTNNAESVLRPYQKYAVDYRLYENMEQVTGGTVPVNTNDYQEGYYSRTTSNNTMTQRKNDSNESRYVQELQPAPIVESGTVSIDEDGNAMYHFMWDTFYRDSYCWTQGKPEGTSTYYDVTGIQYISWAEKDVAPTWAAFLEKTNYNDVNKETAKYYEFTRCGQIMNAYYFTYANAGYRVDLIGTTLDGEEAVLESKIVDTPIPLEPITNTYKTGRFDVTTQYERWNYQVSFVDRNKDWNYPKITARIMRLGKDRSVTYDVSTGKICNIYARKSSKGETFILPRYSNCSIDVRLMLDTIAKPSVVLTREEGKFNTNNLDYDVSFGAITDEKQKKDLGGYLITVKQKKKSEGSATVLPHYYYVIDMEEEYAQSETIHLDFNELQKDGVVIRIMPEQYTSSGDMRHAIVDLSDFNTGDEVSISVKAIVRTNATNYCDGEEGVENEITIPARLVVPDVQKLAVVSEGDDSGMPSFEQAVAEKKNTSKPNEMLQNTVTEDVYRKGIVLQYQVNEQSEDPTNYMDEATAKMSVAIAVYDTCPSEDDTSMGNGRDENLDNPSEQACWNTGARKTIYTKASPANLGYVNTKSTLQIPLQDYEEVPGEFAGKWLKVALQATSTTRINSKWTDQDADGVTRNYKWIHIPKLLLDDIDLVPMDPEAVEESEKDVKRYYYQNAIHDEETDALVSSIALRSKTLAFHLDERAQQYSIYMVGTPYMETQQSVDGPIETEVTPTYAISLKRHLTDENNPDSEDGTWDVYLDEENVGNLGVVDEETKNYIVDLPMLSNTYGIYTVSTQLRLVEDETGAMIQIVLPDLTEIEETDYENNPDYFCMMQVMVMEELRAGNPDYIQGNSACFVRSKKEENFIEQWMSEIKFMDATDGMAWYNKFMKE